MNSTQAVLSNINQKPKYQTISAEYINFYMDLVHERVDSFHFGYLFNTITNPNIDTIAFLAIDIL